MKRFFLTIFVSLILIGSGICATPILRPVLRVGISSAPPFVIIDSTGISGICVDLWEKISINLNRPFIFVTYGNYQEMMNDMENGNIDLTIDPMTITNDRLTQFQLSVPFYSSHLGVIHKSAKKMPLLTTLSIFLTWSTLKLAFILLFFGFIFAVLIWFAEKRKNAVQFRKGHQGIVDGLWWAMVTMTTVGYGDKVPKSKLGRFLTIVWMLFAIALFFVFTAEISSEVTINKLDSDFNTLDDFRKLKIGTIEGSGYASLLKFNKMKYVGFNSLEKGTEAVINGNIDAFIEDEIILWFLFNKYGKSKKLSITSTSITEQYLCFAGNRNQDDLIDQINPQLVEIMESSFWPKILTKYGVGR